MIAHPTTRLPWFLPRTLAAIAIAAGLIGCNRDVTDKDIRFVSIAEVRQWHRLAEQGDENRLILIDPRSPRLFKAGHITGAENIQLQDIDPEGPRLARIEQRENIVVYGDNPGSAVARAMTKRLMAAGYGRRRVRLFAGGLDEWRRNALPITRITIEEQRGAVPAADAPDPAEAPEN